MLAALGLLIVYGTLYPFNFSVPQPDALERLFSNWTLLSSRGDMLGNLVLFVPWGLAGMLADAPRSGTRRAALHTALTGFVLALGCQVAQIWIPSRNAALSDVFWNMLGVTAGALLGRHVLEHLRANAGRRAAWLGAACLLAAWLLAYWLPLLPSIDFQLLKNNLRAALNARSFSLDELMHGLVMALMSGYLISRIAGFRASLRWLPALLALAAFGKLFIHGAHLNASALLGFIAGTLAWWAMSWTTDQRRNLIVALALIAAYTVGSLAPFELRDVPGRFGWVPLAAMLEGSMLANAQALVNSLLVFTSFLFLVHAAGGRPAVASVGLALWVLAVELAQTLIATRTADITQPLLVLLIGQAFRLAGITPVETEHTAPQLRVAAPAHTAAVRKHPLARPLLVGLAGVTLSAIALSAVLHLPGIPYNVRELFLGGGHPLALAVFAVAMLWAGAGSAWLGDLLSSLRGAAWLLPPAALAVSLVSLSLLSLSVTGESIGDISGSSNLYWFVTQKNIWGDTWRAIFLGLGAVDLVSFVERCVRYAALYAPLPIMLGLMIAARRWVGLKTARAASVAAVLACAALTLWLCKAIAFDWSSTDNLNELIAHDGEWGWGGGGFLYGLLALVCLNSLLLAESAGTRALRLLGAALFTVAALPLGWWLLNQGLESQVHKYGSVFSGAQFLLGPDRRQALPTEVLFGRWAVVQAGVTLMIAVGICLGRAVIAALRSRRRAAVSAEPSLAAPEA